MQGYIRFDGVSKAYSQVRVIENLDLDVTKGEFLSLLGPSGSGKTTILMMLAGFEAATSGTIWLEGKRINKLPPHKRGMGVVFQNYALFPHMSVAENVAFPLQMRGVAKADIARQVAVALDRVQLAHLGDRKPDQLSGGQQQRVALTRCLVFEPKVILMDEPLGALDKQLREQMQLEIRELHRRLGLTIVFVTHDQSEALTMSDRIAIFDKGRIAQIGTAAAVYDHPRNQFVSQFIGETNLLSATVLARAGERLEVVLADGARIFVDAPEGLGDGREVAISIRPERLVLGRRDGLTNSFPADVDDVVYQGNHLRLHLSSGPLRLVVRCDRTAARWEIGSRISVSFDPSDCSVFAA
jgi:putative spermidine/putrescine transport system ATP-binding protein